jgi:hypothetical protein
LALHQGSGPQTQKEGGRKEESICSEGSGEKEAPDSRHSLRNGKNTGKEAQGKAGTGAFKGQSEDKKDANSQEAWEVVLSSLSTLYVAPTSGFMLGVCEGKELLA